MSTATGAPVVRRWPLERVLFAMAGSVTLLATALSALVSPWFLLLAAFVGINQWLYAGLRACPASLALQRLFGFRSSLYGSPVGADSRIVADT